MPHILFCVPSSFTKIKKNIIRAEETNRKYNNFRKDVLNFSNLYELIEGSSPGFDILPFTFNLPFLKSTDSCFICNFCVPPTYISISSAVPPLWIYVFPAGVRPAVSFPSRISFWPSFITISPDADILLPIISPLALMLPDAVKLVAKLAVSAFTACDEDNSNVISCETETAN